MFGFDDYIPEGQRIEYLFKLPGFIIALVALALVAIMAIIFKRLNYKKQNIFLYVIAGLLIVLEIGRISYDLLFRAHIGGVNNFQTIMHSISFQLCAQMVWYTAIVLLLRVNKKKNTFFYTTLYSVAGLGALLAFGYIDMIHVERHLYHFTNWQTLLTHTLLMAVPVMLIVGKRVEIKFKNLWMPLAVLAPCALIAGIIAFKVDYNFMYMIEFNLIGAKFPINLPILTGLAIILELLMFLPFGIKEMLAKKNAKRLVV